MPWQHAPAIIAAHACSHGITRPPAAVPTPLTPPRTAQPRLPGYPPQGPGLTDDAEHSELKFLRSGTAGCAGASARPAGPRILRTFASSVAEVTKSSQPASQ